MTLPWLADVLRAAGLTVVEHAGWQTRMAPGSWTPRFGVVHATAAPRTQPDDTQVRIVRDGRSDLPGPIAVACVDRTGRWHVLAAGRCNTTLVGTAGPYEGLGNAYAVGVEACNDNISEPWPPVQYDSYARGWAAICRRLGWTASRLVGHKEHTPGRKSDPTFAMDPFRARVAALIVGGDMALDTVYTGPDGHKRTVERIIVDLHEHLFFGRFADSFPDSTGAALAELLARPPVQAAPVDVAAVKAALLDPEVLAKIAAAVVDVTRDRLES